MSDSAIEQRLDFIGSGATERRYMVVVLDTPPVRRAAD